MADEIPTIILCGGRGTRISEVNPLLPKPLLTIGERPILARVRGKDVPAVGAAVGVHWQPSAAHIFEASSGRRVAAEFSSVVRPKLQTVSH